MRWQPPNRYTDAALVASGGMGEIYRAQDSLLGRCVAVKVLAEWHAADEDVRRRFTREARAAARLSAEPGIVTIYDVGEHDGRPYIVMEHLDGGSLADRVARDGVQPPERVVRWLEDAAHALDAAHAREIVHRDVKPGNLLLDEGGGVHVADFGIASAAGLESFTQTGTVLGTAGYLSPEQAQGERATAASDRYALGVVAFELLTGARPFERDSIAAEATAHVTAPVPAATKRAPQLPAAVDEVFARALAKEPAERFPSCVAFVQALRGALSRQPAPVVETHVSRRRRTPVLAALAVLALAALGAVTAAVVASGGDGRDGDVAGARTPPKAVTVVRTVTAEGETVRETVTTEAPEPAARPETTAGAETAAAPPSSAGMVELSDAGVAKMRAGDYEGALPLLEQAVAKARGTGYLVEAYASYNLAATRFALGRCDGVLELLDRSEAVQGQRAEIDRLRADARDRC